MMRKRLLRSTRCILLLVLPLVLAACNDSGGTGPGEAGSARVSLLLTDAPGDLTAAVVTITDVYLQGEGGRAYLLEQAAVTTDLLSLSNDVVELVEDYEIPAGTYSQLRFVISGAYIEMEDGRGGSTIYATSPHYPGLPVGVVPDGTLQCPSCDRSGFKVLLGPLNGDFRRAGEAVEDVDVVFDGEDTILVDFDVSRSFGHQAGNSGKWVMRPTLKATRLLSAAEVVVRLRLAEPQLELPLVDDAPLALDRFTATLSAVAGGDPKEGAFTDSDGDGVYEARFGYLFPGEYQLGLVGNPGVSFLTDLALPVTVEVEEGSTSGVDIRLTDVSLDLAAQAASPG